MPVPYPGTITSALKELVVSESGAAPRPRRPAYYADLTAMIDAAGGHDQPVPSELAASTAAAVLSAGREPMATSADIAALVGLADSVGLETLRALWRGAEPVSLANSLWALYLLRSWCGSGSAEVVRLWGLGEPLAPADAVVAGVSALADQAAIETVADTILIGAFTGDFAIALERAAAVFRVLAAGRRQLPQSCAADGLAGESELADRNDRAASSLALAAQRWRAGTLR